jgi:hypothetical protein
MTDAKTDSRDTKIETFIDENLERVFAALLEEEIPERFRHVMRMLEARESCGEGGVDEK